MALDWVVPEHTWYWMLFKRTEQDGPRVVLVESRNVHGETSVVGHETPLCRREHECRALGAKFIPTTAPPEVGDFE